VPKFFAHFDLAIKSNKEGKGYYLVGNSLTTADLFVMQVFDGVSHAVPRLVASLQKGGQYPNLFSWRSRLEEDPKIGPYLKSGRRLPFALGLYRHYPELDGEAQ
jgi:glutathione S-transferase